MGRAARSWQETPPEFSSEILGNFLLTLVILAEEEKETLVADYVGNLNLLAHQVYDRKFHHLFTKLYGCRTFKEKYVLHQL